MERNLTHFAPQYMIEFEPTDRHWVVIDTENDDAKLGHYYEKDHAKNAARLFNECSALLKLRTTIRVISDLLDTGANNLMEASDCVDHPRASANLIRAVAFNVEHIRVLSKMLKDAIKTDGGE